MAEIASLSQHTKRLLQQQINGLEQEIARIDEASNAISDPDHQCRMRVGIARRYQVIADLQLLINETPTLEDAVNLAIAESGVKLANSLIASIN